MRENFNVSIMLKESMYMIFLSAHSEFKAFDLWCWWSALLKFKALTPGTDGQLAGHPNITRLLEPRITPWGGSQLATLIFHFANKIFSHTLKRLSIPIYLFLYNSEQQFNFSNLSIFHCNINTLSSLKYILKHSIHLLFISGIHFKYWEQFGAFYKYIEV